MLRAEAAKADDSIKSAILQAGTEPVAPFGEASRKIDSATAGGKMPVTRIEADPPARNPGRLEKALQTGKKRPNRALQQQNPVQASRGEI
jgi:hypothetical protein